MADIEEEQIEKLKRWWDENGKSTIAALVLGTGGVLGYQAWQNNTRESAEAASVIYEDMVAASVSVIRSSGDNSMESTAKALAAELRDDYSDSTYAVFAALHLARLAVMGADYDKAVEELNWVLDQGVDRQLEVIVRLRLARTLLAQGKHEEALRALDAVAAGDAQKSSLEEVRGDIHVAMGEPDKARAAYQLAMDHLEDGAVKPMLALKLADIPEEDSRPSARAEPPAEDAADEDDA